MHFEPLESRLALSAGGAGPLAMIDPADGDPAAPAELSPIEEQRAAVLALVDRELAKREPAVAELTARLAEAHARSDRVEIGRMGLWIQSWNEYGQRLTQDRQRAATTEVITELDNLYATYRTAELGLVPLTELGTARYLSYGGGLYPDGRNSRPDNLQTAALRAARSIVPLDAQGRADIQSGRIVMITVGMSNTSQQSMRFIRLVDQDRGELHPRLRVINGAQGGKPANDWVSPNAPTWNEVDRRLSAAGLTPQQVQVVWVKQARARPNQLGTGEQHIDPLADDLRAIVQNIKIRYPNAALVYLSSRTRAWTDDPNGLNPEPFAYESAFAVKQVVEAQLAGDPALNPFPARGEVRAPLVMWGPYLWADGSRPRDDGFTYLLTDLAQDRTHPSTTGADKVAYELMRFFTTDSSAQPWFLPPPRLRADLDGDGRVGLTDAAIIQRQIGLEVPASRQEGDVSGDGRVTRLDVFLMMREYGQDRAASSPAAVATASSDAEGQASERPTVPTGDTSAQGDRTRDASIDSGDAVREADDSPPPPKRDAQRQRSAVDAVHRLPPDATAHDLLRHHRRRRAARPAHEPHTTHDTAAHDLVTAPRELESQGMRR